MPQTIIVSNRLPVMVKKNGEKLEYYPGPGGLATGMSSFTEKRSNLWLGWPGITSEELTEEDKQSISKQLATQNCYPIFLTKHQLEAYYNGYSNSILWPYLHDLPIDLTDEARYWRAYREVNQLFAQAVAAVSEENSQLWVHDYHLMVLPAMLRELKPRATIGFFSHVPFPDVKDTGKIQAYRSIVKGLLGGNLVGFHTKAYAQNFLETCQSVGSGVVVADKVIMSDHVVQVTDFPLGIDYVKYSQASSSKVIQKEVVRLRARYGRRKIILTVDRLDPSKGFIERLTAYREFLATHPRFHKKVMMVMLAVPSRSEVKAYQDLKAEVDSLVATINQQFGLPGWKPIDYIYENLPFERLSALYQIADVAFVSPLKDGMNLVAKEYIASKSGKSGVLILSQNAGAAAELGDALLVDPHEPVELTNALARALKMPRPELQLRLKRMQTYLAANTVQEWTLNFMKSLQLSKKHTINLTKNLRGNSAKKLISQYKTSSRRLVLLDYDGVLAPFEDDPTAARLTKEVKDILISLGSDPKTDVFIISGRSEADLTRWLGKLPVGLAAEHGASIRGKNDEWRPIVKTTTGWKQIIRPVLEKYAHLAPGAFVEDKMYSLVWHYRKTSPYYAQKYLIVLKRALAPAIKAYGLKIYSGNKVLEIKPPEANKGAAAKFFLLGNYDFIMAIGDDFTDEDIFAVLPRKAYSIKVGRGNTKAGWRLSSPESVIKLLKEMSD